MVFLGSGLVPLLLVDTSDDRLRHLLQLLLLSFQLLGGGIVTILSQPGQLLLDHLKDLFFVTLSNSIFEISLSDRPGGTGGKPGQTPLIFLEVDNFK